MQKKIHQTQQNDSELNLRLFIRKIIETKFILFLTTLIFVISAFLFSFQIQPKHTSSLMIEIGNYSESPNRDLIEDLDNLIQDLKINFIYKDENESIESIVFSTIQGKLINIQYTANSREKSIEFLSKILSYVVDKHNTIIADKKTDLENSLKKNKELVNLYNSKSLEYNEFKDQLLSGAILSVNNNYLLIDHLQKLFGIDFIIQTSKLIEDLKYIESELKNINTKNKTTKAISKIKTKTSDTKKIIILASLFVGFFAGVFVIYFIEFYKKYIRSNA